MSAKILTTAFLAIRSTIPGELAPDADAAVAVVGRAAADRLRYAASIRILGVGFRAYIAAVDLLQALQRIVGEGAGHRAPALLRQIAVVVVLKGGNLVTRVRTCSDPGQLMRIVILVEIGRPACRFAYAPVVELIVAVVLDQRGAAVPPDVDDAVQAVVVIAVVGDGAVDCLRIRVTASHRVVGVVVLTDDALTRSVYPLPEIVPGIVAVLRLEPVRDTALAQPSAGIEYEIDAVAVAGQHRGQPAGGVAAEDLTAITQHRSKPRMPRQ